jgi:DNA-directed RNA polymerase specialized sigma24 family protein
MGMALASAPSQPSRQPNPNKNDCPICGQLKTAWSAKCSTCEANRQRYLAAIDHKDSDPVFLANVEGRTLQSVANEMGITRQGVHKRIKEAQRRVAFLQTNPLPLVGPTH